MRKVKNMENLVPGDATPMECAVVAEVLHRVRRLILQEAPPIGVVDSALEETVIRASEFHKDSSRGEATGSLIP